MKKPKESELYTSASIIKRAMLSKILIPPDDPVFKYEYNQLALKDRDLRKKFHQEIKACCSYYSNTKKRMKAFVPFGDVQLKTM